jgi:Tfp pilus assembly protein PilF
VKPARILAVAGLSVLVLGNHVFAAAPGSAAPMSSADEAILAYDGYLRTADRYLSEGDYAAALENLYKAAALRPDDARLHEKLAVAHDADREPAKAFASFEKAGELYLAEGDTARAARVLEYLRASGRDKAAVAAFEKKLEAARLKRQSAQ